MRHPALRRSARHSKRDARPANAAGSGTGESPTGPDPATQNRPAPPTPLDGDHNQGGVRPEGLDYQRDLGSEQDA
ncbi:hypothetical protein [Paraburkholderia gardini]|uniref:Uncharacterized protein n=1 Tax=Paraburkholderia gardini TaxID=2823469 RepID=A0ABN7QDA3_9BURK|nr:hypothetical protein [Paraburkholderia gardini]CAG4886441.1 hypothetical protein R54767_00213 [Paraburkholderia gardini]